MQSIEAVINQNKINTNQLPSNTKQIVYNAIGNLERVKSMQTIYDENNRYVTQLIANLIMVHKYHIDLPLGYKLYSWVDPTNDYQINELGTKIVQASQKFKPEDVHSEIRVADWNPSNPYPQTESATAVFIRCDGHYITQPTVENSWVGYQSFINTHPFKEVIDSSVVAHRIIFSEKVESVRISCKLERNPALPPDPGNMDKYGTLMWVKENNLTAFLYMRQEYLHRIDELYAKKNSFRICDANNLTNQITHLKTNQKYKIYNYDFQTWIQRAGNGQLIYVDDPNQASIFEFAIAPPDWKNGYAIDSREEQIRLNISQSMTKFSRGEISLAQLSADLFVDGLNYTLPYVLDLVKQALLLLWQVVKTLSTAVLDALEINPFLYGVIAIGALIVYKKVF